MHYRTAAQIRAHRCSLSRCTQTIAKACCCKTKRVQLPQLDSHLPIARGNAQHVLPSFLSCDLDVLEGSSALVQLDLVAACGLHTGCVPAVICCQGTGVQGHLHNSTNLFAVSKMHVCNMTLSLVVCLNHTPQPTSAALSVSRAVLCCAYAQLHLMNGATLL